MTASAMSQATMLPADYAEWIADVKLRIRAAQQRAALAVNQEMLLLYWQIGRDILDRQAEAGWGTKILSRIEADLRAEFPEMRGFSRSNLLYMRAFAEAWPNPDVIVQRFVGQLPWGQNITLLTKLKTPEERLLYAARAVEHGWSRPLLTHHIELRTLEREGKAVTNFEQRLPRPQSDLARETLKDPYRFDFLSLGSEAEERDIEAALVTHITKFLLELGAGFAFVGRQVHLEVGGRDFYIDLLFYHLRLRCFVVLELKAVEFEPEHTGKLNFYLSAVDEQLRHEHDNPTIGLLLCKTNNRVIAEYALRDVHKPIGVAEYQLVQALPAQLEANLPSIERLEAELTEAATWLRRWWRPQKSREDFYAGAAHLRRMIVCSSPQARPIFAFLSSAFVPTNTLQVFAFADDYSFGVIQSSLHWEWTKATGGKVTERIRYTSEVWRMFPWPQDPTEAQVVAVADAARRLRRVRAELMEQNGWTLRALYQAAEVDGAHPLKDAQAALDAAVADAYGMPPDQSPVEFLLELNQLVAEDEEQGRKVRGPGLPDHLDPKDPRWFSTDCIEPPPVET